MAILFARSPTVRGAPSGAAEKGLVGVSSRGSSIPRSVRSFSVTISLASFRPTSTGRRFTGFLIPGIAGSSFDASDLIRFLPAPFPDLPISASTRRSACFATGSPALALTRRLNRIARTSAGRPYNDLNGLTTIAAVPPIAPAARWPPISRPVPTSVLPRAVGE